MASILHHSLAGDELNPISELTAATNDQHEAGWQAPVDLQSMWDDSGLHGQPAAPAQIADLSALSAPPQSSNETSMFEPTSVDELSEDILGGDLGEGLELIED